MATRRRYKPRSAEPSAEPQSAPEAVHAAPPMSEIIDDIAATNPLAAQIVAQQRADDLQRQSTPKQPTVDEYIDTLPGLSDHKRAFLRQHPAMLDPVVVPVMAKHYRTGLQSGLSDDTRELDQYILANVARDLGHRHAHQAAGEGVGELAADARPHAAGASPDAPTAILRPRRSIPMAAPVSRQVPSPSGVRTSTQITLSPAEREIAAISFKHLPPNEREMAYARNKKVMLQMKRDGRIQGDG